jgi:hypothetical protein
VPLLLLLLLLLQLQLQLNCEATLTPALHSNVPYGRRRFKGDENPLLILAHGVMGFAKGLGSFFLISGVASGRYICDLNYAMCM